jgi:glycosyltransferase involved in cell wall biosynthesis
MGKPTIYLQNGNQDWILGVIAKDLKRIFHGKIIYAPTSRRNVCLWIKFKLHHQTDTLIFLHQESFLSFVTYSKYQLDKSIIVFYTHQSDTTPENPERLKYLMLATKIIVCSSEIRKNLIKFLGPDSHEKIVVVIGGADTSYFQPINSNRNVNSIIFVSQLKERKRPDLILRTVRGNKDIKFTLHGKGWKGSKYFEELITLDNFKYFEFNFANSNQLYNESNIFMSLSDREGAPMPALEALAAGCKIILTDTGFARDLKLISNSVVIVPINPSDNEVASAVDYALSLPNPEPDIDKIFSYENFLKELVTI